MEKRRDFTEETLQLMYENVDTNDGGFVDFFDDIGQWFSNDKELKQDLSNINEWFGYILEAMDISESKLDIILQDIEHIETVHVAKIETFSDRLKEMQRDLNAFFDKIDQTNPVMPKDTAASSGLSQREIVAITIALIQIYGPGASIDTHLKTPEQIAQARIDAEDKGIHLPLTKEQLEASQAAYDRIKSARENIQSGNGIGVGAYNQDNWKGEFGKGFADVACYATCVLLIAQFYGHDITMQDLIDGKQISPGANGLTTEPYFHTERECYGASEAVYCQKIYDELMAGRPTIVSLYGEGPHFVIAVGLTEGATAPYSNEDIWVMDPADGKYKSLATAIGRKDQYVIGLQTTSPGPGY